MGEAVTRPALQPIGVLGLTSWLIRRRASQGIVNPQAAPCLTSLDKADAQKLNSPRPMRRTVMTQPFKSPKPIRERDDPASFVHQWARAIVTNGVARMESRWGCVMTATKSQAVQLVPVVDRVLEELIQAAVADAEPDDVTPPLGEGWTVERVTWLRAYHRERRAGFTGGRDEETSAIRFDGRIVGASRLHRTNPADASELEWGIWLVRSARGQGIGQAVFRLAAKHAARAGARRIVARTTAGNEAALQLLRRVNAAVHPEPDGVVYAVLELTDVFAGEEW